MASGRGDLQADVRPAVGRSGLYRDGGGYVAYALPPVNTIGSRVGEVAADATVPLVRGRGVEFGLDIALTGLRLGRVDECGQEVGSVLLILLGQLVGFGGLAPSLKRGKIVDRLLDLLSDLSYIREAPVKAFVLRFL